MYQWRRVITLAILTLLTATLAQAGDDSTQISLGLDSSIQKTSVQLMDKSAAGLSLRLETPFIEVKTQTEAGQEYQLLNLPGAEMDGPVGQPSLPLITRLVAIPDGQTLRVTNVRTRNQSLDGSFLPWPAQDLKDMNDKTFNKDQAYYLGNKRAEAQELVTVGEPGLIRGLRVVPVRFRPVTWTPGSTNIDVAAEIEVSFEMISSNDGNKGSAPGRPVPESFASMYEDEVIGYQRNGDVVEGFGSYLLIHPNNATVLANLQPLIEWRQRQGYNVVVASTAQTGTTTSSIKNYIQTQYNSLEIPLEFVTLAGDVSGSVAIPTYQENLSGYGGRGDHDYTTLEGGDVLADVHLGRLSVDSASSLANVVNKIVKYEKEPYMSSDSGWFSRAGLAGDPGASGYSCIWVNQWVKQQLLELNYTQIDTIWSGNFSTLMVSNINQGESLFTYRGYYGMSGMNTSHIGALSNGEKLPFALILTCDTGSIEGYARSEAFLRNSNGGGIASIGTATTGTHTRYNNCMFQGIAEGVLNSGDSRVGPGLTRGKLHLYENYYDIEPNNVSIWSTWNNLIGDPATALWSGIPRAMNVQYPTDLTPGANLLPISVSDGGIPKSGLLVTVFRKDMLQVSALTDANGLANLPLEGLVDGEYLVTVTGRNIRPHLGGFNVGDMAASVNFASLSVDDSSLGNNDGYVNPGESVELNVDLTNHGTGGVSNVSADLSSHDLMVNISQGSSDFGYIGSGATVGGQQSFVVDLDASVLGGSTVALPLEATDGSDTWTSMVYLTVDGPAAEIRSQILGSNINPGQSTSLTVDLRNVGNLATTGVTGALVSNSRWLTVSDDHSTFGSMSPGGSANNSSNTFTINAGAECYPGHTATLNLELIFNEGNTATLPIIVTVGDASSTDPVGPDNYGYYGFDNTDAGYEFAPTYDWVEISPSSGGQGTSVGLTDTDRWQDDVVIMDLPFSFTYYGQTFTKMSVCSNGWISMGGTDLRHYRNWTLPSPGCPDNLIAVYWDDLHTTGGNSGIYQWYDAANNRLIIEWDNVVNAVSGVSETFQVILQDPAYGAGDTGDGIITMNYQDVTPTDQETGYATVGIQNEDRDDAVLYTYFNRYPSGAATLNDGRSITFRTVIPQAQGILSGEVTNAGDGAPIDGASVSILGTGLSVASTVDGEYQTSLSLGTYNVAVYHPSFAPDTTFGVVIEEDIETVVNFSLNDIAGPAFEMQVIPESTPDTNGPYDVVFKVSDYSGIQETHFYYTSSATGGPYELTPQPEGPADTWRVSIPGQPDATLVQYWLTSTDLLAFSSMEPAGAPYDVHSFMVAQTTVLYNSALESVGDWTSGAAGDNATTGIWENADPNGITENSTVIIPEDDHTEVGTRCWITGQDPQGSEQGVNDVDGGLTTLQSPVFDISSAAGLEVQYYRWYTNDTGYSPNEDAWQVQAQAHDGSWINLENTTSSNRSWQQMNFILDDHLQLGNTVQFRFLAQDNGGGSVVEACVDDFSLTSFPSVVDAAAPEVSLTSPDGGEAWGIGSNQSIDWDGSDDVGIVNVEILLSTDGGANFNQVIASGPFNGSFDWEVPSLAGNTNRIKVICTDSAGNSTEAVSSGNFTIGGSSAAGDLPVNTLSLAQNAPNPFNPRTEIKFSVPSDQDVNLRIYNVEGKLVRTLLQGRQDAGSHTVMWSGLNDQGSQVASGLYFYRLITDSGTLTRKMTLLK